MDGGAADGTDDGGGEGGWMEAAAMISGVTA